MKWRMGKHRYCLFQWDWFDGSLSIRELGADSHAEDRQGGGGWGGGG